MTSVESCLRSCGSPRCSASRARSRGVMLSLQDSSMRAADLLRAEGEDGESEEEDDVEEGKENDDAACNGEASSSRNARQRHSTSSVIQRKR